MKISDNLYRFEDTCNVYAIRDGDTAVLIDFGAGSIMSKMGEIGVTRVTDVLMTHHHRDQGQGLAYAAEAGVGIWAPHAEQDLFSDVESHWQAREIFNSYNVRQDRFSLLRSVPVEGTLHDYGTYHFGGYAFTVAPTPGHTVGSISLLAEIDGQRVAFTGDLIAAPGKVWSMAATQWSYNGVEGVVATILSLLDLKTRQPEVILPAHGEPITEPGPAIDLLVSRLQQLLAYRRQNPRLFLFLEKPYVTITPHLLRNRTSTVNSYVLLSESGKALVIDFGYDFMVGTAAGTDRASRRPWLYTLTALKRDYGVQTIDVAIPTHHHDDHVAGLNLLREVEGTQVWAAENFADVLERPSHYDLPCLWYDPIPVDRVLTLNTPIAWEEYEVTLYELPGHTLYAVAIVFTVDGKRVLVTGDQYQGNEGILWNYVYQSRFRIGDYRASAELYRRLMPDLILSGHWEPLWVQPSYLDVLQERGEALERLHRQLLPLETLDLGAEGFAAWIHPYQLMTRSGNSVELEVEIHNPFPRQEEAIVRMVVPENWTTEEDEVHVWLEAGGVSRVKVHITPPAGLSVRRARVAADLTVGSQRFGQQAEALVTVY